MNENAIDKIDDDAHIEDKDHGPTQILCRARDPALVDLWQNGGRCDQTAYTTHKFDTQGLGHPGNAGCGICRTALNFVSFFCCSRVRSICS